MLKKHSTHASFFVKMAQQLKGLIGRGNSNENHNKSKFVFTATIFTTQCRLSVSVNQHCHKVQPIHK